MKFTIAYMLAGYTAVIGGVLAVSGAELIAHGAVGTGLPMHVAGAITLMVAAGSMGYLYGTVQSSGGDR